MWPVPPLQVVVDSREQAPWAWNPSDVITEIGGLAAGDYALLVDTEPPKRAGQLRPVRFAIERKSLSDFAGTISTGWDRFQRELVRMETFPARIVIVESDYEGCCFMQENGELLTPEHEHSQLTPAFIARRIAQLIMQGVEIHFAGNAELAAGAALHIFRERMRMLEVKP